MHLFEEYVYTIFLILFIKLIKTINRVIPLLKEN